jgi:hypothetical protein
MNTSYLRLDFFKPKLKNLWLERVYASDSFSKGEATVFRAKQAPCYHCMLRGVRGLQLVSLNNVLGYLPPKL